MRSLKQNNITVNSGATADIAFLLLIFFMVATTFHKEKSIIMKLPPSYDGPALQVSEDRIISILVNASNEVMIENKLSKDDMAEQIVSNLTEIKMRKKYPIININMHPDANYKAYMNILSKIKYSIKLFRSDEAKRQYGIELNQLNHSQFRNIKQRFPIRITETQAS